MTHKTFQKERRHFLKVCAAAGGGLLIGVPLTHLSSRVKADFKEGQGVQSDLTSEAVTELNAWVHIDAQDRVTLTVDKSEMGQGIMTALPMLIAEELEVDWQRINTRFAPADPVYKNPALRAQVTGGSTSVSSSWENLRLMGAAARELLIAAAAEKWGVRKSGCYAENGRVYLKDDGRFFRYGELAELAAIQPVADTIALKKPEDFRIIGQPVKRLDTPQKTNGSAVFGIDVQVPNMRLATVIHPPVFGSTLRSVDDHKINSMPGDVKVVPIDNGVAVVANTFWQAKTAADALDIVWEPGGQEKLSSESIFSSWAEVAEKAGSEVRDDGDIDKVLGEATRVIEAVYQLPFQAHATMEPINCCADVRETGCEIWAPTQNQTGCHEIAAKLTGLEYGDIKIHTTYLGGGFGRRAEVDYAAEAIQISQAIRAPVKVIWSREEDIQHDYYRPANYNLLKAG